MKLELVSISTEINKHFPAPVEGANFMVTVEAIVGYWGMSDGGRPTPVAVVKLRSGCVVSPREASFGGTKTAEWTERIPEFPDHREGEFDWLDVPIEIRALLPPDWDLPVQTALFAAMAGAGDLSLDQWDAPDQ